MNEAVIEISAIFSLLQNCIVVGTKTYWYPLRPGNNLTQIALKIYYIYFSHEFPVALAAECCAAATAPFPWPGLIPHLLQGWAMPAVIHQH